MYDYYCDCDILCNLNQIFKPKHWLAVEIVRYQPIFLFPSTTARQQQGTQTDSWWKLLAYGIEVNLSYLLCSVVSVSCRTKLVHTEPEHNLFLWFSLTKNHISCRFYVKLYQRPQEEVVFWLGMNQRRAQSTTSTPSWTQRNTTQLHSAIDKAPSC